MKNLTSIPAVMCLVVLLTDAARAEDAYYSVRVGELKFEEGPPFSSNAPQRPPVLGDLLPYVVLEGPGEAYLALDRSGNWGLLDFQELPNATLAVRAPAGGSVSGKVFTARSDLKGLTPHTFALSPSQGSPTGRVAFLEAKEEHYRRLLGRNQPGAAWFRYQAEEARKERFALGGERPAGAEVRQWAGWERQTRELEDTFAIFTGGRAMSENLQLDRLLAPRADGEAEVDVATLPGITVREMDWKPLVRDLKPEKDPLAAKIPADQHAILFRTFQEMIDLLEEADRQGTPVLELIEPRAEDARTKDRYQRQLCLEVNDLARLLGSHLVKSVAITGSDPYLRTGSDLAILFEAKSPEILSGYFRAKQEAARKGFPEAQPVTGEVEGTAFQAVVSPDRAVSSYLCVLGDTVIVSNSLHQLRRVAETAAGKSPALASLDEYVFFRGRYPRADQEESALLIVTDAAIRRWCGPRWRIATSRRTRAAAALAEIQAANLDSLAAGTAPQGPVSAALAVPGAGAFHLGGRGAASATHGTLEFLTPIAEIPLERVTAAEAEAYRSYRDRYQANWRQFFDPIALRITRKAGRLGADLTVMPLIAGTEYRELIDITTGAEVRKDAGDPHPRTLVHFALALNPDSRTVKEAAGFLSRMAPGNRAGVHPLAWLGGSISLYADQDPFWEELARAGDPEKFMREEFHRLPVALHLEVKSALGLAAFLAAVRGFADQTGPGLTVWENLEHRGQPYVRVSPSINARGQVGPMEKVAVFYAATADALVVTLNEDLLKRALDRQAARKAGGVEAEKGAVAASPWLGANANLRVDQKALGPILKLLALEGEDYSLKVRRLSWNNLPILNEWKRRFPGQDPVELHERFWQTRLLCPGGGSYVWNEKYRTMESTVYGHPGEPKLPSGAASPLSAFASGSFGLTFENQGLRARVELERAGTGK